MPYIKSTRGKRLLLSRSALEELHRRWKLGVPMTKLIETLDETIAHLVLTKLIKAYDQSLVVYKEDPELSTKIQQSLFPRWLVSTPYKDAPEYWEGVLQQTPHQCKYEGYFPLGHWETCNEDN